MTGAACYVTNETLAESAVMPSDVVKPNSQVFRDRAEECRAIAALFRGERTRAILLRVADDYERMADQAAMLELFSEDLDRAGIVR